MDRLLIFGDSWPQGSELKTDETPFGELLGQHLDVPVNNFAEPSTSIPHLLLQLRKAIDYRQGGNGILENSVAVFFLTHPARDLIWNDQGNREVHLNPMHPTDVDIRYYSRIYTPNLATFRVNSTLLALAKICEIHGIQDRYIWGWETETMWPEINAQRFWRRGTATVLDLFAENDTVEFNGSLNDYASKKNNRFIWPNSGHPNQAGHELIAQELETWLKSCT